jgi:hypothetical protein
MLYFSPASQASLISDIFFLRALFLVESRKEIVLERRRRIFSRSPVVLVMAFPRPGVRVQSAVWSSSSAART